MTTKTFTGKNVDEATENALRALDANLEDVEIKVVNPGRSGILGFGGEPAEIEVRLLNEPARASRASADDRGEAPTRTRERRPRRSTSRRAAGTDEADGEAEAPAARPSAPKAVPTIISMDDDDDEEGSETGAAVVAGEDEEDREDRRHGRRRGRRGGRGRRRNGADGDEAEGAVAEAEPGEGEESYADFGDEDEDEERGDEGPPAERDTEAEQLVGELLDYFLGAMGVVAETFVRDETDNGSLIFEIEGEDAGLLIGRRGETLQALQFLTRLIVNRQLGRKAYMMIDIEGYRERRYDMLRRLARRTAGRVASSGRPAALDPMSPGERRIVHMSLSRHPRVRTESEGEGSRRHVVIRPKR